MNICYLTRIARYAGAAAAGGALLTACWDPASAPPRGPDAAATIEGRVEGDAGGLEGAGVVVARLRADGSLENVSVAEVKTDAEGRFAVKTGLDGVRGLMVVARKEAREWKAMVSAEVKQGGTVLCRPLDLETTLESEVYAAVKNGPQGDNVSFVEVASFIDADMALRAQNHAEVKSFLISQMEIAAKVQASVMAGSGRITAAMRDMAEDLRLQAQADFEARLHAAMDAEARAWAESEFHLAHAQALHTAGIAMGEFAKARQAAFRAMIKSGASATVEAETSLAWLRTLAWHEALTLEAALREDLHAAGANPHITVEAGSALRAAVQLAENTETIDSAFARFRENVSAMHQAWMETVLGAKVMLADSSQARASLVLSLQTALTAQAVSEAYARFYAEAEAEIKAGLSGALSALEPVRIQALTRAAILVGISGAPGGEPIEIGIGPKDGAGAFLAAALEKAKQAQAKFLIDTGIALSVYDHARSQQVYAQALAKFTVGAALEARMQVLREAHDSAAMALRSAMEAELLAAHASEAALKIAEDAGAALQAAIAHAVSLEAMLEAYTEYHDAAVISLRRAFTLQSMAIENLDGKIREQTGLKALLTAAVLATFEAEGVSRAHLRFAGEVGAQVESAFSTSVIGPSPAQVDILSQTLVLANMCD